MRRKEGVGATVGEHSRLVPCCLSALHVIALAYISARRSSVISLWSVCGEGAAYLSVYHSLLNSESRISSGVWGDWISRKFIGSPFGMSRCGWHRRDLATSFKEVIIRTIIIGINLMGSESISRTSIIIRVMGISHRVSPTGRKQRRIISTGKIDPTPPPCIRMTYSVTMACNSGWENELNDQHAVNSGTRNKNPTRAAVEYMTTAKIRDEDMTAKYIAVSLLTVLRRAGTSIPGCIGLISRARTMTDTRTVISKGTDGRFNWRVERSGRVTKCLPKARARDL